MMRQKMKRMIGFLLSLALMVGLLPGMSLTAYAATAYSSYVGTTTKVKFNDFEWYIIADNSTDSTPTVTMLAADEHFGTSEFSNSWNNSYNSSTVKLYLESIVAGNAGDGKPNFAGVADAISESTTIRERRRR